MVKEGSYSMQYGSFEHLSAFCKKAPNVLSQLAVAFYSVFESFEDNAA